MLEKLITNLKKSLPGALRKKSGAEEDNDEIDVSENDEAGDGSELNADEAAPAEDKKKKQTSMIIRVVVILGLGYYALDEFVLKKSAEPTVEELLAKAPKKNKKVVPAKKEETPPAEAQATASNADSTVAETPSSSEPATQAPIENVNVLDKNAADTSSTQTTPEPTTPTVTETPVETPPEPKVDQSLDKLVESVDQNSTAPMEVVKVPSQDQRGGGNDSSLASKIVEDIAETAPPAYDQVGRGLVYNCKDKYWACIDKPAYVVCNKNMKWNSSKGKTAECVVQAVYNSEEDCAKIQKYNVSTNKETSFCQN